MRNYIQQLTWNLENEVDSIHVKCWGGEQFIDDQSGQVWFAFGELMDSWWRSIDSEGLDQGDEGSRWMLPLPSS